MGISLLGITLHVKDVERSKQFYERLPEAKVLIHHAGQFDLNQSELSGVMNEHLGLWQPFIELFRAFHVLDMQCDPKQRNTHRVRSYRIEVTVLGNKQLHVNVSAT